MSVRSRPPRKSSPSSSRTPRWRTAPRCFPMRTCSRCRATTTSSRTTRNSPSGTTCSFRSSSSGTKARPAREAAGALPPGGAGLPLARALLRRADVHDAVAVPADVRPRDPGVPADVARGGVPADRGRVPRLLPSVDPVRRCGHRHRSRRGLPARLLDRLSGPAQELLPAPAPAALLRIVRDPHAHVAIHPVRPGPDPGHAEEPPPAAAGLPRPGHGVGRHGRHRVQLPPVHGAAPVRGARTDRPARARGRRGPLRQQVHGVPPGDAPAGDPGHLRRLPAYVRPRSRRLRQCHDSRRDVEPDGRQHHPKQVPAVHGLPGRLSPVGDPHGRAAPRDRPLLTRAGISDDRGVRVSAVATTEPRTESPARPPARGVRRRWTSFVLPAYSAAVILYLLIPIGIMILYGFNVSRSHLPNVTFKWQGFTTEWYREWNQIPGLTPAFFLSL